MRPWVAGSGGGAAGAGVVVCLGVVAGFDAFGLCFFLWWDLAGRGTGTEATGGFGARCAGGAGLLVVTGGAGGPAGTAAAPLLSTVATAVRAWPGRAAGEPPMLAKKPLRS